MISSLILFHIRLTAQSHCILNIQRNRSVSPHGHAALCAIVYDSIIADSNCTTTAIARLGASCTSLGPDGNIVAGHSLRVRTDGDNTTIFVRRYIFIISRIGFIADSKALFVFCVSAFTDGNGSIELLGIIIANRGPVTKGDRIHCHGL